MVIPPAIGLRVSTDTIAQRMDVRPVNDDPSPRAQSLTQPSRDTRPEGSTDRSSTVPTRSMKSRWSLTTRFRRSTLRLLALLASLPAAVVALGLIYMLGMAYLERSPRSLLASVEWASETLTTTGYGGDARWHHPAMAIFVIAVQFTGLFLVFLIFPIYVLPYFEERFEARLPHSLPGMDGRVLFHRYGRAVDSLIEELRRVGAPFVILEQDADLARRLHDRGYPVVVGNLEEDVGLLQGVEHARALITDADDHADSTFIMMAREQGYTGPDLCPRGVPACTGRRCSRSARRRFTRRRTSWRPRWPRARARAFDPQAEGLDSLSEQVGLAEYRVHAESPLAGRTLGQIHMRERLGVNLIGQWRSGEFVPARGPETRIAPGAILVVIGGARAPRPDRPAGGADPGVRADRGRGVRHGRPQGGGDAARRRRGRPSSSTTTPEPGVDVVGNVFEQSTLEQARVREASTVVLALSNDSAGVFATAVIRDYAPQIRLIARVNRASSVPRLYQAGADFALSMGQVAGQLLAHHILGNGALSVEQRLRCVRLTPGDLAGAHPWKVGARERSGATVVGVERDGKLMIDLADEFRLRPHDVVLVCGTVTGIDVYVQAFQAAPWRGATAG